MKGNQRCPVGSIKGTAMRKMFHVMLGLFLIKCSNLIRLGNYMYWGLSNWWWLTTGDNRLNNSSNTAIILPNLTNRQQKLCMCHDGVIKGKLFPHPGPFVGGHRSTVDTSPIGPEIWRFFYVSLNKLLIKQLSCWWFETPWRSCV